MLNLIERLLIPDEKGKIDQNNAIYGENRALFSELFDLGVRKFCQ